MPESEAPTAGDGSGTTQPQENDKASDKPNDKARSPASEKKVVEKKAEKATTRIMRTQRRPQTHQPKNQGKQAGVWSKTGRFVEPKFVTPGPSHYEVPNRINGRSIGSHNPGYTLRARTTGNIGVGFTRTKPDGVDQATPGPGMYDPYKRDYKGKSFSPLLPQKVDVTPGPSDYKNIRPTEGVGDCGSKYTMRARTKSAWAADMGADWRRPTKATLSKTASAPSLGRPRGQVANASSPGPADYINTKPFGNFGPKKTMSAHLKTIPSKVPGPGAHDPYKPYDMGRDGPKYTLHDRTKFQLGGSFIDGDTQKHRPVPITPGPGHYTFNHSFHVPSFNKLAAS